MNLTEGEWWFEWKCPRCGWKPAEYPKAPIERREDGAAITLTAPDCTCLSCGYALTDGDLVILCHEVGGEVDRTAERIPAPPSLRSLLDDA